MFAPFNSVNTIDHRRIRCDHDGLVVVCEIYKMVGREFALIKYVNSLYDELVAVELVCKENTGDVLFGNYILTHDGRWEDGAGLRADSLIELLPAELFDAVLVSTKELTARDIKEMSYD